MVSRVLVGFRGREVSEHCTKGPHWGCYDSKANSTTVGGAEAKPLLGSAITVPWLPTGGAGAKPLLWSANTVQCQVR